ncbi:Nucleolar protein 13 [Yamadazyma tenuis]|uniref:RRM domain-containing protein n=1 Tax=Candida tenuis (strain ATCC 10573 / BCRC 21748 / CBS 615 / JCM 9827 / NBRC 10315 / NRRL Y-1498 / VKM Y-70) TaxID=590646 RepID=G3B0Y6_CANTC|nr:uncharacterized protein CANTEDRAFT_104139 [Yamadazyma tenuis ATCC 10573]EGV64837.1 hypothetical protein CANTEDRAFT_104139 [Yamadazyma tenuis ATCC 10573]WEJ97633.1 Nucleolar protein 13 [Yamadazyma tenuis]
MSDKESKDEKRQRKLEKKQRKAQEKADSTTSDLEEIEIDLSADIPLNKKQQRLLKKGKLNLDKIRKKHPAPKPATDEGADGEETQSKPERSKFGVWIGNLSFDTTREDILRYIKAKTDVEEDDIVRFNLPKKQNKIKGFCYADFKTEDQMNQVIKLSETNLNGRNLLIKNAQSFEGRPEADKSDNKLISASKNPPSRILFVGNLSFDTTEDLLEEHFRHCGEIIKIRMATFEDTGKCKGFAFVDFKDEAGATAALTSALTRKLINRPVRMEYGEDRSKRTPKRFLDSERSNARERTAGESNDHHEPTGETASEPVYRPPVKRPRREYEDKSRVKSSVALANAQRASAAIVPSSGKKITFD